MNDKEVTDILEEWYTACNNWKDAKVALDKAKERLDRNRMINDLLVSLMDVKLITQYKR